MGNTTDHYFGAYLEIKTKMATNQKTVYRCKNSHDGQRGAFCSRCGRPIKELIAEESFYPSQLHWLIDEEWEDVLVEVTPPSISDSDVILARSNLREASGTWLYLENRWGVEQIKDFPSNNEIEEMKASLAATHADVIQALRESPNVVSVTIKAGYVLDTEY